MPSVHTIEVPVGRYYAPDEIDPLSYPAIANIVTCAEGHTERKIRSLRMQTAHSHLNVQKGGRPNFYEITDGFVVDEENHIYGFPIVADASYACGIQLACGHTPEGGEFITHNIASGVFTVATTGTTIASEIERILQHSHPHRHRDTLAAFNDIYRRLTALEAHHPAGPSGSSDGDSDTEDSNDDSSDDSGSGAAE